MIQRPPTEPKLQVTPALIAKLGRGGKGARGALEYDAGKAGAELISTNLEGTTPREWTRQMGRLREARKSCVRAVDHWSISLDPRLGRLSIEQWREVARGFIQEMGYQCCPNVVHRHVDEPQDHVHLTVLRLRHNPANHVETVSDSNNFKRSHLAAAKVADLLGLKPLAPGPDALFRAAPADQAVGASQRARRRGTRPNDAAVLRRAVESAVLISTNAEELCVNCAARGVEVNFKRRGNDIYGWNLRLAGSVEWLSGSSVHRSMGWTLIAEALIARADLRSRAQASADAANNAFRQRASSRVAAMTKSHDPKSADLAATRTLTPPLTILERRTMDFRAKADTSADPLCFTGLPPPVPPTQLDELAPEPAACQVDGNTVAAEAAQAELSTKLRSLSNNDLRDLVGLGRNVPLVVLTPELVAQLLRLVIKVLTLGAVDIGNPAAARHELAHQAGAELARRREQALGQPFREQVQNLKFEQADVRARRLHLSALSSQYRCEPIVEARLLAEAWFDRRRVDAKEPTLSALRDRALSTKSSVDAIVRQAPKGMLARVTGAAKVHRLRLDEARAKAHAARQCLLKVEDEMKALCADAITRTVADIQAKRNGIAAEMNALGREIEHSIPRQLCEIERRAEDERPRQVYESQPVPADTDSDHNPTCLRDQPERER